MQRRVAWTIAVALVAGPLAASPASADPSCAGRPATIVATAGAPVVGTRGNDVIVAIDGIAGFVVDAGGGRDAICTGDGDDHVIGGDGDDTILTGRGQDRIEGGPGGDTIDAGPSADLVHAGNGPDLVQGGPGADVLWGEGGRDRLDGGSDPDVLRGGLNDDALLGGAGPDRLDGGPGLDQVDGGPSSDTCTSQPADPLASCEVVVPGPPPPALETTSFRGVAATIYADTADVDGDGIVDVVRGTSDRETDDEQLEVILGDGDGGFVAGPSQAMPIGPLALAELSGDGRIDAVIAHQDVRVLRGDGHGGFTVHDTIPLGGGRFAYDVEVGDVTGDGHADVVLSASDESIVVLPGNAAGGFRAPVSTPLAGSFEFLLADVVGDSTLEAVQQQDNGGGGTGGSLVVGSFRRNGSFRPLRTLPNIYARDTAVGDLNADGRSDLVVDQDEAVRVITQGPGGAFTVGDAIPKVESGGGVVITDVDLDDDPDIVTPAGAFRNEGGGSFTPGPAITSNAYALAFVAAVDTDGDGLDDLVMGGFNPQVDVHRSLGAGVFEGASLSELPGGDVYSASVGDLTGDGRPDIAVPAHEGTTVFPGLGDGHFGSGIESPVLSPYATSGAIGDLDGDHDLDVVGTDGLNGEITAMRNDGAGHLTLIGRTRLGAMNARAVMVDMDGDGDLDVMTGNSGSVSFAANDGTGSFTVTTRPFDAYVERAVPADLNGDGTLELVTADSGRGSVSIITNPTSPEPIVSTSVQLGAGSRVFDVAAGDVTGDGHMDVVATDYRFDTVTVLPGRGDGTLGSPSSLYLYGAGSVELADLDGDGVLDIAASGYYPGLTVITHVGAGQIVSHHALGDIDRVEIADLDGDWRPDVIGINWYGSASALLHR